LVAAERPSVVLRTVWRIKALPLGSRGNERPDYQQLLTNVELVVWMDSSAEAADGPALEERVITALTAPENIKRFGGLSLGESTHLVDEVTRFAGDRGATGRAFLQADDGRLTFPVWVDHVGSAGTRYVTGDLCESPLLPPDPAQMPIIAPT